MQFNNIPANLRVPLFFAELDPRFANTAAPAQRTLLIGQITGSATLVANTPTRVISASDGMAAAGAGSILAGMIAAYRLNDPTGELWVLPLADNGAGAAATGSDAHAHGQVLAGDVDRQRASGRRRPEPGRGRERRRHRLHHRDQRRCGDQCGRTAGDRRDVDRHREPHRP